MNAPPPYPIRIERASGFAELVLDRPDRRNAITGPLVEGLLAGLDELRTDEDVKAVLLRGAGGTFCSGLDLDAFQQDPPPDWRRDFGARWLDLHVALFEYPKPVVGALERYAIAGGSGLALACDLLVAGEGARLQVAEAALGMAAPMNVAWLQLKLGLARVNDLVMTARPVQGPELAQMGLATSVPDRQVLEEARALAGRLAAHPGHPHASTKRVSAALLGRTPREWFEAAQSAAREPGGMEAE